jgi:nucleotide-binding universal stress UspA family protein
VKVIITTDGKAAAEHAIHEACRLLPLATWEVVVVSVLDPSLRIGANEDMTDDLAHALAELERRGVRARAVSRRGDFATEIVAVATEEHADLIVLGHPLRSRLTEVFSGSVTNEVLRAWHGASLVVS